MPIQVSEHTLTSESRTYFSRVLRDDAEARKALEQALSRPDFFAFEAVFNGRPVALLLLQRQREGSYPVTLVVHPATRGRGVGTEFAGQVAHYLPKLRMPPECRAFAARAGLA